MLLVWLLPIILQIICIIHLFKTGRAIFWIFILIFLPVAGAIAYFLVEILPGMINSSRTGKIHTVITNSLASGRKIKILEEQLELTNTVNNRIELADEYLKCGFYAKAIEQYQASLAGLYRNDSHILSSLVQAFYLNKNYEKTIQVFEKIADEPEPTLNAELRLLYAHALEQTGNYPEAENVYRTLIAQSTNLKVMYYFGNFLKNRKRSKDAHGVFEEIILIANRSPAFNVNENKKWINEAKKELNEEIT